MSREAESTSALIERMRAFEADHVPDGWPCIRMRDITALCNAVEAARSAALEEAAEVCDRQHDRARTSPGAARANACADAIRALKEQA
ncbi:hypothetical protein [Methyloversatilis discipulorum]|uniref:hypothetical protein n=1 Tax=Methyloversatilis discipulorum TaxID=1119528 RepID=UPI00313812B9